MKGGEVGRGDEGRRAEERWGGLLEVASVRH